MKRRIAFVLASNHIVCHGGIGQFLKGFLYMAEELGWVVDVICDKKPPNNDFFNHLSNKIGRLVYPDDPYSYSNHKNTFAFFESYNIEKMANIRTSLMDAFRVNLYDMVLLNISEAIIPAISLGLDELIPIVYYTHNSNFAFYKTNRYKDVFHKNFDESIMNLMKLNSLVVATQTDRNKEELDSINIPSYTLPMPLPDNELMIENAGDREGVLFIGRWETRKNFKEYLRVIEETNLPAKVLTNKKGYTKFKKALDDLGAKYEIKYEIYGKEKADFITSSKVFYMPSLAESYGFALLECIGHMPCVVLKGTEWYKNFDESKLRVIDKKDVVIVMKKLYNSDHRGYFDYLNSVLSSISDEWNMFIEGFDRKFSKSSSAKINEKDNVYYHEHINQLGRTSSIEDVISVLRNVDNYNVTYTKEHTWLSKSGYQPRKLGNKPQESTLEDFLK